MKVIQARSTKIILVKQYQVPLEKLLNPKYVEELRNLFRFGGATLLQDPTGNMSGVNYTNGLHNRSESEEISILNLTIESRKIGYQLDGSSEEADAFYNTVKTFLSNLIEIEQEDFLTPVVAVDETEIISRLDFSAQSLFSNAMYNEVSVNLLDKASGGSGSLAKARLGGFSAVFQIDYEPLDFGLIADNRININRKDFIVQSAPGYGIEEQVYITRAPLDTETHMQFLSDLEKKLN